MRACRAHAGRSVEDQIGDTMQLFMRRKFVRKVDRKFKKPKPGKKRVVKFPRTLEPHAVREWPGCPCMPMLVVHLASQVGDGCGRITNVSTPFPNSGVQDANGWTEDAFYMWLYDRPTSMWTHAATVLLPVLVIAACLFPLAPWCVDARIERIGARACPTCVSSPQCPPPRNPMHGWVACVERAAMHV